MLMSEDVEVWLLLYFEKLVGNAAYIVRQQGHSKFVVVRFQIPRRLKCSACSRSICDVIKGRQNGSLTLRNLSCRAVLPSICDTGEAEMVGSECRI